MTIEKRVRGLHYHQWLEDIDGIPLAIEILGYDGAGAMQGFSSMLGLEAGAGSSTANNVVYLAAIMGEVHGGSSVDTTVNLTGTANIIAGVIGKYSHKGTSSTTFIDSAVRAEIGDGVTAAYAAFLAVIGGDSGASTTATSAFAIDHENSTAANGFLYGVDLAGSGAHDSYAAPAFRSGGADIRLNSGGLIVSLTTAITANSTTTSYAAGTLAKTSNATGRASLFVSDATKWQFLTNS